MGKLPKATLPEGHSSIRVKGRNTERAATELVVTTQEGSGANTACDQSSEAHDTQEKKT